MLLSVARDICRHILSRVVTHDFVLCVYSSSPVSLCTKVCAMLHKTEVCMMRGTAACMLVAVCMLDNVAGMFWSVLARMDSAGIHSENITLVLASVGLPYAPSAYAIVEWKRHWTMPVPPCCKHPGRTGRLQRCHPAGHIAALPVCQHSRTTWPVLAAVPSLVPACCCTKCAALCACSCACARDDSTICMSPSSLSPASPYSNEGCPRCKFA